MTMSISKLSVTAGAALLAIVAAATAIRGVGTSSEALLKSSFSAALSDTNQQHVAKAPPVVGSEDFWLNAMRNDASTLANNSVSIGDHIDLTFAGRSRQLQVESVTEVTPTITAIDTGAASARQFIITARDTSVVGSKPLRLLMEIPATAEPLQEAHPARVL